MTKPLSLLAAAGLAVGLLASPTLAQPKDDTRTVVKTADDLPRHTYTIEGKPSEFIFTEGPFKALVQQVKGDIEADLAKFKIEDPTTLQGYYGVLQTIAMLEDRDAEALAIIEKIRGLESKESKKLTTGLVGQSMIAAKKAGKEGTDAYNEAFKRELMARVEALPWATVREAIVAGKGRAELMSRDLIVGSIAGSIDPIAEQSHGEVSNQIAWAIVGVRAAVDKVLPVNPMVVEVYAKAIKGHDAPAQDILSSRAVALSESDKATPVVVAIWDSGVDVSLYSKHLWVNPKETANGKDDDGNGYIDDINGIAYDLESARTPDLLHPLTDLHADKAMVTGNMKGMMDLEANIDSPEATALKKYLGSLKAEQVSPFIEDLGLFGNYSHGTHVAGIAADGNPFIRLLPVRLTFDFRQIPKNPPSIEQATKEAQATRDSVAYMKAAGVRVCNMSWGGSRADIEEGLEKKNIGKTREERAEMSRAIFKIGRDALEEAMRGAPDILFVAAAGNSDNDNTFSELIPSGLNVPNMVTIGAVDQSGKPTSFTTFGKNVTLYANGFEVESNIPGGQRMKFSGTSMAAPNVTNLAAKVLAVNPKLTTAQVIEVIRSSAEPMEGYEGRMVIDPKKAVEAAKKK